MSSSEDDEEYHLSVKDHYRLIEEVPFHTIRIWKRWAVRDDMVDAPLYISSVRMTAEMLEEHLHFRLLRTPFWVHMPKPGVEFEEIDGEDVFFYEGEEVFRQPANPTGRANHYYTKKEAQESLIERGIEEHFRVMKAHVALGDMWRRDEKNEEDLIEGEYETLTEYLEAKRQEDDD